jgi:hypothetical protein
MTRAVSWAMILCKFHDVPVPNLPISYYTGFIADPGKLGLRDYWRDVSFGMIDLSASLVAGWYEMQYSYRDDWWRPRTTWTNEAINQATQRGIDLFQYFGVLAIINAPVTDSSIGAWPPTAIVGTDGITRTKRFGLVALNTRDSLGQEKWRYCKNCQGLFYDGNPDAGYCPNPAGPGRGHDTTGGEYILVHDGSIGLPDPVQDNWRWCSKCEGLFYAGNPDQGTCPKDPPNPHIALTSGFSYRLVHDVVHDGGSFPDQTWYWCKNCQGLFYGGNQKRAGRCPRPKDPSQTHDGSGSGNYSLLFVGSHLIDQMGAHETGHGLGLEHAFDTSDADCGGGAPGEYCDNWDIMGGGGYGFYQSPVRGAYDPVGPSPCAPTLYKLGWLGDDRVWTGSPGSSSNRQRSRSLALLWPLP